MEGMHAVGALQLRDKYHFYVEWLMMYFSACM
jgi:hypothetical protein